MSDNRNGSGGSGNGRGGSPAGFIARTIISDIQDSTSEIDTAQNNYIDYISSESGNGHDNTVEAEYNLEIIRDLRKSGLEPRDMNIRPLTSPEKATTGVPIKGHGYVIPYFDISGNPLTYYRARILNSDFATNGVKYKQPRKSTNHIYFPKHFRKVLLEHVRTTPSREKRTLLITEGEKKAAAACKMGFPCIAVSGVDSWRTRSSELPEDTQVSVDPLSKKKKVKVEYKGSTDPDFLQYANGFMNTVDTVVRYNLNPIIIYDSDDTGTLKAEVQRAATMLGYEFVFLGIHASRIKQVILPPILSQVAGVNEIDIQGEREDQEPQKTGLDDFLMDMGPGALRILIARALADRGAFPKHPNPRGFIQQQLQNQMSRKTMQQVASIILTELDAEGKRLKDKISGLPYYFDERESHLIPVVFGPAPGRGQGVGFHEQPFGTLLYQRYGVSANDNRVLTWLASQFTGEDPIEDVTSRRIHSLITEKEDPLNPHGIAYQISDSQFLAVSPDDSPKEGLKVHRNGDMGIMFEQNQMGDLDSELILEEFEHQVEEAKYRGHLQPWWQSILDESSIGLHLKPEENAEPNEDGLIDLSTPPPSQREYVLTDKGKSMRTFAMLLCYVSPFLFRWRGLQLPVEMAVGPPGSGKTSLYELRLSILTGRPLLRNMPADIKDWQASLAHAGGLHVTDNVHFLNKDLKQRISDEICRITTEPEPQIEQRRYYTNTDTLRFPVNCVFAFTSIQTPFHTEDLIQRSVTFHTEFTNRNPQGDWVQRQLEDKGGQDGWRERWVAHHMAFLHLFLREEWDPEFQTGHRLAHLEQALTIAGKVLGLESLPVLPQYTPDAQAKAKETEVVPETGTAPQGNLGAVLTANQAEQIEQTDYIMQAIRAWLDQFHENKSIPSQRFFAKDITDWCATQEDFMDDSLLINSRRMGKYMQDKSSTLAQVLGIHQTGSYANRTSYRYEPRR